MSIKLQFILIISTILFLLTMIRFIKKSKLSKDMATVWVLFGLFLLVISIFPQIIFFISDILDIYSPINALFIIMIFILLCFNFYLFLKLSILEEKIKNLVQHIALTEKDKNREREC